MKNITSNKNFCFFFFRDTLLQFMGRTLEGGYFRNCHRSATTFFILLSAAKFGKQAVAAETEGSRLRQSLQDTVFKYK